MAENKEAIHRMKELVERLREASKAYYAEDKEIMSNFAYDKLCDELAALEQGNRDGSGGKPDNQCRL